MGLLVRRAEPQDAPAVARVHVASWRQAYRGLLPQGYLDSLSVEARTMTWAKAFSQLPGQSSTTLVGELDGQIVGFACVGPSRDDDTDTATGELWGLYLDPAHWGVGHGHTLHLHAGLRVALDRGARLVHRDPSDATQQRDCQQRRAQRNSNRMPDPGMERRTHANATRTPRERVISKPHWSVAQTAQCSHVVCSTTRQ